MADAFSERSSRLSWTTQAARRAHSSSFRRISATPIRPNILLFVLFASKESLCVMLHSCFSAALSKQKFYIYRAVIGICWKIRHSILLYPPTKTRGGLSDPCEINPRLFRLIGKLFWQNFYLFFTTMENT